MIPFVRISTGAQPTAFAGRYGVLVPEMGGKHGWPHWVSLSGPNDPNWERDNTWGFWSAEFMTVQSGAR